MWSGFAWPAKVLSADRLVCEYLPCRVVHDGTAYLLLRSLGDPPYPQENPLAHPAISPPTICRPSPAARRHRSAAAIRFARAGMNCCIADFAPASRGPKPSWFRRRPRRIPRHHARTADGIRIAEVMGWMLPLHERLRAAPIFSEQGRHPACSTMCSPLSNMAARSSRPSWGLNTTVRRLSAPAHIARGRSQADLNTGSSMHHHFRPRCPPIISPRPA